MTGAIFLVCCFWKSFFFTQSLHTHALLRSHLVNTNWVSTKFTGTGKGLTCPSQRITQDGAMCYSWAEGAPVIMWWYEVHHCPGLGRSPSALGSDGLHLPPKKGSWSLHPYKTATDMIPLYQFNSRLPVAGGPSGPWDGATILAKLLYVSDAFTTLYVLLKPKTCPVRVLPRDFWRLILRIVCSVDYSL